MPHLFRFKRSRDLNFLYEQKSIVTRNTQVWNGSPISFGSKVNTKVLSFLWTGRRTDREGDSYIPAKLRLQGYNKSTRRLLKSLWFYRPIRQRRFPQASDLLTCFGFLHNRNCCVDFKYARQKASASHSLSSLYFPGWSHQYRLSSVCRILWLQ